MTNSNRSALISVIIPNFNYGRFLQTCIDSVLSQTHANIEIILVDDGSTDNSLELAKQYEDKINIIKQQNLGVNAARNRGLLSSKGAFVAFCDSDDFWHRDKLARQLSVFEEKQDSVLVYCGVQDIDENGNLLSTHAPKFSGPLKSCYISFPSIALIPNAPSVALIRRESVIEAGMWDESLRGNAEDWDFFRRLSLMGEFAYTSEILTTARKHSLNRGNVDLKKYYLDNLDAMKKAVADERYNWNAKSIKVFVRKFEIQFVKGSIKKGRLLSAVIHFMFYIRGKFR
jgi:glycosyltransferase involved in cell wall biosynthesis